MYLVTSPNSKNVTFTKLLSKNCERSFRFATLYERPFGPKTITNLQIIAITSLVHVTLPE